MRTGFLPGKAVAEGRPAVRGRRWRSLLATAVLAVTSMTLAGPASGEPGLELSVPSKAVTVGDHVEVHLQARGPAGLLWGTPGIETAGAVGESWAVVEPPKPVEGSNPPSWTAVLAPLRTGKLDLPPITVTVREPGGAPQRVSADGASRVEVVSVLPPGEKVKPAPLADPVGVTGFPWEWVLPIGVGLLLLALVAWAIWRWRKRSGGEEGSEPSLPPLEELRSLVAELAEDIGSGDVEELCDRLAHGVRRFLQLSTGEPAGEMTSFEIQRLARRSGWPTAVQVGFRDALQLADRVRFARRPAAEAQLQDTLRRLLAAGEELDAWLRPAESSEGEAA